MSNFCLEAALNYRGTQNNLLLGAEEKGRLLQKIELTEKAAREAKEALAQQEKLNRALLKFLRASQQVAPKLPRGGERSAPRGKTLCLPPPAVRCELEAEAMGCLLVGEALTVCAHASSLLGGCDALAFVRRLRWQTSLDAPALEAALGDAEPSSGLDVVLRFLVDAPAARVLGFRDGEAAHALAGEALLLAPPVEAANTNTERAGGGLVRVRRVIGLEASSFLTSVDPCRAVAFGGKTLDLSPGAERVARDPQSSRDVAVRGFRTVGGEAPGLFADAEDWIARARVLCRDVAATPPLREGDGAHAEAARGLAVRRRLVVRVDAAGFGSRVEAAQHSGWRARHVGSTARGYLSGHCLGPFPVEVSKPAA